MRIQNNITAMNTHRQYTINNDNVAKAAEKLSSGYRINRAGDDAAGLAISEKMRSQIRGLNMATKNSQDAISLVQTAEGALQETHAMLQRMNELAVQAATGTNQELDRSALAKEFEQLKREINDVAEQTTFNNMKILDGSLSYVGAERSAQTAGVTVSQSEIALPDSPLTNKNVTAAVPGAVNPNGTAGVWEFTIPETQATTDAGAGGNITASIAVSIGGTTSNLTVTVAGAGDGSKTTWGAVGTADRNTASVAGAPTGFTATISSGKITLTQTAPTAQNGTLPVVTGTGWNETTAPAKAGSTGAITPGKVEFELDTTKMQQGDTVQINGKVYTFDEEGDGTGKKFKDLDTLKTAIEAEDKTGTNANVTVTVAGNKMTLTQVVDPADNTKTLSFDLNDVKYKAADGANQRTTIEFDFVKMKDGDKIDFKVGSTDVSVTKEPGMTKDEFMDELTKQIGSKMKVSEETGDLAGKGIDGAKVNGNAIIVEGMPVTDPVLTRGDKNEPTNAIRIQVGALENEQLAVSIDSMNTAGLKLDEHSLDTQDSAGAAITAVRDAINKVSDQRATLGAMQNRLDHKIANLKVSSENLSAAESRIRDVDMASEMTNFTKNNILSQAATAMLAQANSLPQNVLSLLG